MRRIVLLVIVFFVVAAIIFLAYPRRIICSFQANRYIVSLIDSGAFSERIPCTGLMMLDSIPENNYVNVHIDELYSSRVTTGLKATTPVASKEYTLEVISVSDSIFDGRFEVKLKFDSVNPELTNGQPLRLRLLLGQSVPALLLPLGGFYRDTGGSWIYRIKNGNTAIRQRIKLGRKNTEYFEILKGLNQGDSVITSAYDLFNDEELIYLSDYKGRFSNY